MSKELPILDAEMARASIAFDEKLAEHDIVLRAAAPTILQVNVGKLCNQACRHCHVDASPKRTEIMTGRPPTDASTRYGDSGSRRSISLAALRS